MASETLSADGSTSWHPVDAYKKIGVACSGDFGSGTVAPQFQDEFSTAVSVSLPSGIDGTTAFVCEIKNPFGFRCNFRLNLSGSTSPDLDCTFG